MNEERTQSAIPGRLIEEGKKVYVERLQSLLEPDQIGRFVAIEPKTGHYFLGNTGSEALVAARKALPDSLFYLARIGYRAAHSIGLQFPKNTSAMTETVIRHGRQLYDVKLKALLEPQHKGRFVAIEPTTGEYFLGDTDVEALLAAHVALPECRFYL